METDSEIEPRQQRMLFIRNWTRSIRGLVQSKINMDEGAGSQGPTTGYVYKGVKRCYA